MCPHPAALLLIFAGIFSICGAVFDWEWFMGSSRAWLFVKVFGRTGARLFYTLVGAIIVTIGVLGACGRIPIPTG